MVDLPRELALPPAVPSSNTSKFSHAADASIYGAQFRVSHYSAPVVGSRQPRPPPESVMLDASGSSRVLDISAMSVEQQMATFPALSSSHTPTKGDAQNVNTSVANVQQSAMPSLDSAELSVSVNQMNESVASSERPQSLMAQGCHTPESTASSLASVFFGLPLKEDSDRKSSNGNADNKSSGGRSSGVNSRQSAFGNRQSSKHQLVAVYRRSTDDSIVLCGNTSGGRRVEMTDPKRARSAFTERRVTYPDDVGLVHKESGVSSETTCSSCKSSSSSCDCGATLAALLDAVNALKRAVTSSEWWHRCLATGMDVTSPGNNGNDGSVVESHNVGIKASRTHHTVPPSSILRKQGLSSTSSRFTSSANSHVRLLSHDTGSSVADRSSVPPNNSSFDSVANVFSSVPVCEHAKQESPAFGDTSAESFLRLGRMRVESVSSLRRALERYGAASDDDGSLLVDLSALKGSDDDRGRPARAITWELDASARGGAPIDLGGSVSCAFGRSTADSAASNVLLAAPTVTGSAERTVDGVGVKMLNQYLLLGTIGQGACGKVKVALNVTNNTSVAVKIVHRADRRKLAALQQEVAVMKQLRHKNLVPLYEVIDDPEAAKMYLVMPYIDCGCVARLRSDGTCDALPLERVLLILRQAACGLEYLHNRGVVHRDVKPNNILMDSSGRVYLSDFGVSNLMVSEAPLGVSEAKDDAVTCARPEAATQSGTVLFMAPELLSFCSQGKRSIAAVSPAVDVWALGVTALTLLSGVVPFRSRDEICAATSDSVAAVTDRICRMSSSILSEVVELLCAMLSPEPQNRPCAKEIRLVTKHVARR